MEEEATSSIVHEAADGYEVSLEDPKCLLNQLWHGPAVVDIECRDGAKVACSTMVECAVRKMLKRLNIDSENGRVKLNKATVGYLVERARFGNGVYMGRGVKISIRNEVVESARKEVIDKIQEEYRNQIGEVEISCIDGLFPVHEAISGYFEFVRSDTNKMTLPFSCRQFSVIADLVYYGKTQFKRSELASVYVATTFCKLKQIQEVGRELRSWISKDWKSALSIDSIQAFNSRSMIILCARDDFVASEDYPQIASSLERWAGESLTRKTIKDSLLVLLQTNRRAKDEPRDCTKFIYYDGHKFDGALWTVSELHNDSKKWACSTHAVVNPTGDRIVSWRPGPVGILSTTKGFTKSCNLPHDPLAYGFPYTFQDFPYVCLVFSVYDDVLKHYGTELWQWKEETTFEPIKCSPMWDGVGNMVRVKEDLFYLTGRRRHPEVAADTTSDSDSYQDDSKHEAGLYLMKVRRIDGVLHGEAEMIKRWSLDEYCEKFTTEYFCVGETLYKEESELDYTKNEPSPTVLTRLEDKIFVPADNFQPVKGTSLKTWTLEGRLFGIAFLRDPTNWSHPCGFFEFTEDHGWRDRTLETGFFNVSSNWKPVNDCVWQNFDGEI